MSHKPKKKLRHTWVGIFTTARYVVDQQTMINVDVDPEERESVEDNPLYCKTRNSLNVDTLPTLNKMRVHDLSKALTIFIVQHYQTKDKQDQEEEPDWRDRINVKTISKSTRQSSWNDWEISVTCVTDITERWKRQDIESTLPTTRNHHSNDHTTLEPRRESWKKKLSRFLS